MDYQARATEDTTLANAPRESFVQLEQESKTSDNALHTSFSGKPAPITEIKLEDIFNENDDEDDEESSSSAATIEKAESSPPAVPMYCRSIR